MLLSSGPFPSADVATVRRRTIGPSAPPVLDGDVLPLDPAEIAQRAHKRLIDGIGTGVEVKVADPENLVAEALAKAWPCPLL